MSCYPTVPLPLVALERRRAGLRLRRRRREQGKRSRSPAKPTIVGKPSGGLEWLRAWMCWASRWAIASFPWSSAAGRELASQIKGVRKKLSSELGFLAQPIHIRDNLELSPTNYRITINGVPMATDEVQPDRELAINPGQVFGTIEGIPGKDPSFG